MTAGLRKVVLATHNKAKAAEIRSMLRGVPVEIESLADRPGWRGIREENDSYQGNAILKARAAVEQMSLPALGEDTGLEVDVLGGRPGVRSARFAGEKVSYEANNQKLLELLRDVPRGKRNARFVCVVCFDEPGKKARFFRGVCEGQIAETARGDGGFGYDPLFIPAGETRTFAEMSASEKDRISHRGRAFAKVREALAKTV